ncbi:MAG: pseudouridine synthase [bacterium]
MRIDRFLSNLNYGSRNDIKKYIKEKRVKINNTLCTNSSTSINENIDKVYFDNELVFYLENICIAFNKPQNYICSNIDELYPSILNLLPEEIVRLGLNICGRLDADTEGLVILTSNGNYVHQIISPSKNVYKKYLVHTKNKIENINLFENGLEILDGRSNLYTSEKAELNLLEDTKCIVSIKEGKFHQVKRMFEAIDNEVVYLKRLSVGNYNMPDDLLLGEYKIISIDEII